MKAIFISYNQAYQDEIMRLMDRRNLRGFTSWETVQGRGSRTGEPHLGSHAWPTLNSAILTMVEDHQVEGFLELLKEMDQKTEAQGLRAFVWNIEQTI